VVVSSNAYNQSQEDLVVAQISSQVSSPVPPDEYLIVGWQQVGLLYPSVVRSKLFTIDSALVIKGLGQLPANDMVGVENKLRSLLQL
jgi:mRNA interferase MazF